jgi:hypothetical protein
MLSKILAWLTYAYTALGLVCAATILWLLVEGGDQAFRLADVPGLLHAGVLGDLVLSLAPASIARSISAGIGID